MNRALFEQQIGEGHRAFDAFKVYRDMGPDRSLEAVARKLTKSSRQMKKWSSRWCWQERLQAWAKHVAQQEQAARDEQTRKHSAQWAEDEAKFREEQRDFGRALIKRAKAMLEFPLAKTISKDGKTIVMPTAWNMGHIARLAEVGDKLMALAYGHPTTNAEVTGKDGAPVMPTSVGQVIVHLREEDPLPDDEE